MRVRVKGLFDYPLYTFDLEYNEQAELTYFRLEFAFVHEQIDKFMRCTYKYFPL